MKFDILAFFENLSRKLEFHYNLIILTTILHEDQYTILIIYRSVIFRIRNISDIAHRQNQNTHFVLSNFFFSRRPCRLWNNVGKYCRTGQAINDNMAHAYCMLDGHRRQYSACELNADQGYKYTICNTHCFSVQKLLHDCAWMLRCSTLRFFFVMKYRSCVMWCSVTG